MEMNDLVLNIVIPQKKEKTDDKVNKNEKKEAKKEKYLNKKMLNNKRGRGNENKNENINGKNTENINENDKNKGKGNFKGNKNEKFGKNQQQFKGKPKNISQNENDEKNISNATADTQNKSNVDNGDKNTESKHPNNNINNTNKTKDDYDQLTEFINKQTKPLSREEKHQLSQLKTKLNKELTQELQTIQSSSTNPNNNNKDTTEKPTTTTFSLKSFDELNINEYLKKSLKKNNYTTMTKIQKKAIPILLQHKNVIVKSETGSGKTLAYVIPIYEYLIQLNNSQKITRKDGPYVIIFAPTHELCLQIEETFHKLQSCCINVVYGTFIGGQKVDTEKLKIRKGINVIICTPGRLLYHLKNSSNLNFSNLKMLVFDEGDIMLDMGFEKDIKESLKLIVDNQSGKVNNINNNNNNNDGNVADEMIEKEKESADLYKKFKIFLLSATVNNKIRKLVSFLMKGFKAVGFEGEKEKNKSKSENTNNEKDPENDYDYDHEDNYYEPPKNLKQYYSIIYDEFRLVHLISFLYSNQNKKIIIFVNNCDSVDFLRTILQNLKFNDVNLFTNDLLSLHGKMDHNKRKEIYRSFNKKDNKNFLIATDVASRGLDFPEVDWIVHYDVNPNVKDYVNRMGRSGRLDHIGNSLIFLMKSEESLLQKGFLKKFSISELKANEILLTFADNINKNSAIKEKIQYKAEAYKNEVDENEKYRKKYLFIILPIQRMIKDFIMSNSRENLLLGRKAFKSSMRAYVTFHKHQKDVFNLKSLNLTRMARAFGLYKESTKLKIGKEEHLIDYEMEKKNTKGRKKFLNKKTQNKLITSEFE